MPKLWNTDHQPHLIDPISGERAVMPGESHDFTDEQVAAGIAGSWSDTDPRAGLEAEKAFKRKRDTKGAEDVTKALNETVAAGDEGMKALVDAAQTNGPADGPESKE